MDGRGHHRNSGCRSRWRKSRAGEKRAYYAHTVQDPTSTPTPTAAAAAAAAGVAAVAAVAATAVGGRSSGRLERVELGLVDPFVEPLVPVYVVHVDFVVAPL